MSLPNVITTKTLGTTEKVVLKRYGNGMIEFTPQLVTTATTTSGNATLTSVVSTNGIRAGMTVSGTGIQAGSKVVSFVNNTSITLDKTATAGASGVSITVTKIPSRGPFRSGQDDFVKRLFDALAIVA